MENQINSEDHNTQQMSQNPVGQPVLTPEKPKTKYVQIGGIVLVCFVIFGFGGYYLGKRSNNPPVAIQSSNTLPLPISQTSTPTTSQNVTSTTSPIDTSSSKDKATLVLMEGWRTENIDNLSLKVPLSTIFTKVNCYNSYEYCYTITKHDKNHLSPPVSIFVKTYKGGPRRQEAELDPNTLEQYSFKERLYGNIEGLDALFICKIKECTAFRNIIFVVNGKLVKVIDGVYKQRNNSTTLESAVTNAIISSFAAKE